MIWSEGDRYSGSSAMKYTFWESFASSFLVWRSAGLNLHALPPWWLHLGGRPGPKNLAAAHPGGWVKVRLNPAEREFRKFFGLVSPGFQAPPKKITPSIHAQNRRHSSPISHF